MIIFPMKKKKIMPTLQIPTLHQGVKKLFQHQNTKRPTTSKVLKTAIDYTKMIIFYSVFGFSFIFYNTHITLSIFFSSLLHHYLTLCSISLFYLSLLQLSPMPCHQGHLLFLFFCLFLLRINNGIEIGDSLGVQWQQRSVCSIGVVIVKIVVGVLGSWVAIC